jgi:hypothetical protein
VYALVGNSGLNTLAVICVGGIGCIGAYLVRPVWRLKGISKRPSPPGVPPVPSWLIASGPAVEPARAVTAATTAAGAAGPARPEMLKRPDQLIYEPPEEAKEVSLKKLCRDQVSVKCPTRGVSGVS